MVEIYNESIYDLLTENSSPLEIRANGNKIVLPGAMEFIIGKWEDAEQLIALGDKNRTVAQTKMNSSRLLFIISYSERMHMPSFNIAKTFTVCWIFMFTVNINQQIFLSYLVFIIIIIIIILFIHCEVNVYVWHKYTQTFVQLLLYQ